LLFAVTARDLPTLASFAPTSGQPWDEISLIGTHLNAVTGIAFMGSPAPTFTRVSPSELRVRVPLGATTGPIWLEAPTGRIVSATSFVVQNALPTISSFSPTSGRVNDIVTIRGTHLNSVTGVSFNGVNAPFSHGSDSDLTVSVPLGATSGPVRLDSPAGTVTSP